VNSNGSFSADLFQGTSEGYLFRNRAMSIIDQPLVSVVLVVRNVDRFLAEAIESVLNQTFRDFEFIIVDFGSTDKTKEIVASYAKSDGRIRFSEIPSCSYIEAKIAACSLPTGRYIAIQDADDVSLPERLQAEVEFMESHPEVGLLGGAVQWIDSQGNFLSSDSDYPLEDEQIRKELKVRNPFWHPTVLIRKEAFVRVGGYRAAFTQSDDYDLWVRISEHYRCANLKQKVLYYRIHPQQLSLRKRKDQILCALAVQAAASLRRAGKPDPLDSTNEITPELLVRMGVSEAEQGKELANGYFGYINHVYGAGYYAAVPEATAEMFQTCRGKYLDSRLISDMHLLCAKAYWKQGKIVRSLISCGRAAYARPRLVGRPFRPLLRLRGFLSATFFL
jgi:glycosyltransferase involved in cell wall biosynthesis